MLYSVSNSWKRVAWGLLAAALPGCSNDPGPGQPSGGIPEVAITSAPTSAVVGEAVQISYSATDDIGLELVSVAWGTFDAPVNLVAVSGREFSGSVSHEYIEAGTYLITVSATDTDTNSGSAQVEVVVDLM